MNLFRVSRYFALKSRFILGAAALLLLAGLATAMYQDRSHESEHLRQLTVQANILAASVTAAISFNDKKTAQEYVDALKLDPRLEAVAVYNDAHSLVAGFQRPGTTPIPDGSTVARLTADSKHPVVTVPARQGATTVGSVYLRAAPPPLVVRVAQFSGVALLTTMAVLMLSALAIAQSALSRANSALENRARELADANARLTAEMRERAKTEEALRQSQKMEAVGQLSGGIAHDFNNLLMIIKSSLNMFEMKLARGSRDIEHYVKGAHASLSSGFAHDADELVSIIENGLGAIAKRQSQLGELQRYLDTANEGIDKAAGLTQRLLTFARRQPLSSKSVDLSSLIQETRQLIDHSLGDNVEVEFCLESSWPVLCDANLMENAILNLVVNARDAMPDGGKLTISTANARFDTDNSEFDGLPRGDYVRLRVMDTGVGMTEETRQKAFDPFFTTKPLGKGTGLGLSTILGYVMQSNGHIRIDSEIAEGTAITIVMPRCADGSEIEET